MKRTLLSKWLRTSSGKRLKGKKPMWKVNKGQRKRNGAEKRSEGEKKRNNGVKKKNVSRP
jgi:hypothetical protein